MTLQHRRSHRRGMSLVEVMVVIAIILTLTSILAMGVIQIWRQSRVDTTRLVLQRTGQSVLIHETRTGRAPSDLAAVYRESSAPRDAWGTPVLFEGATAGWDLLSLGEDRTEGGEGYGEDLRYSDSPLR